MFVKHLCPSHFLKIVTLIFELHFDRWPGSWFQGIGRATRNTGWPQKNETNEHVNKIFNFQAIATKHRTFYLNLMHGLHTKFHKSGLITFRLMMSFHNVLKMSPSYTWTRRASSHGLQHTPSLESHESSKVWPPSTHEWFWDYSYRQVEIRGVQVWWVWSPFRVTIPTDKAILQEFPQPI